MSDLLNSVYTLLEENKKNIEEGRINGIPFPFEQMHDCVPVIQHADYHLVTARTKNGKSQLTNFVFLFQTIFYAYNHPDLIRLKFFIFPLEESKEEIMMRFMSYCLYVLSKRTRRVSPLELQSPNKNKLLSDDDLALLKSPEYKALFVFFENHVEFCEERTTVAIDIKIKSYAMSHGTCTYKKAFYKDEFGQTHETKSIDKYTPNDPLEYVIVMVDHVSLLQPVKGQTLLQAIGELSKAFVMYKNVFRYTMIMVQQQSKELGSLESTKQGRIRPDDTFLADCKSTVNDVTHFWGICDPYAYNMTEYLGYDLTKLKHNFRVLELLCNRRGEANKLLPLYFDGAVCYFNVLPAPTDKEKLEKVYKLIESNDSKTVQQKSQILTLLSKFSKNDRITNRKKCCNKL